LFTSGRNGRGLAYVYTGAGGACLPCSGLAPACLPGGRSGGAGAEPSPAAGRSGWRSGRGGAGRLPADSIADLTDRHPVMAGKFRNRILDFVFNPEILARKQFGLRENGQTIFGKPFLPEKLPTKTIWPCK